MHVLKRTHMFGLKYLSLKLFIWLLSFSRNVTFGASLFYSSESMKIVPRMFLGTTKKENLEKLLALNYYTEVTKYKCINI